MLTIYSRIVVPIDGSELSKKALETAITLAKEDKRIEIDVITVMDIPISEYYMASAHSIGPIRESHLTASKEFLNDAAQKLGNIPNKTRTFLLEGNPSFTIIDFAKNNDADLIVMGSRGLSGIKEIFLGSVSHYVVQKSSCPVFIIK